jgi:hypothetical protein
MVFIPIQSTPQHRAYALHFPPLDLDSCPETPTEQAAHYLLSRSRSLPIRSAASQSRWIRGAAR